MSARWSIARAYRTAMKAYTWLPYRFSRGGYAFPVWHYFFEMTRRCNLRCQMCQYIEWLRATPVSEQRAGELTTDEWRNVIDRVRPLGLVTFTGGEPFLREDLPGLIERASRRTRTHLITNGILIDEARAAHLVSLAPKQAGRVGFNFLGTSIEGPPAIHDAIRGHKGAFEKTAQGLRSVIALRDRSGKQCPMIHVTSVIQAGNVDVLAEMPRVATELGANVLNFTIEIRTLELEGIGEVNPACYTMADTPFPHIDAARLERALAGARAEAAKCGVELRMPDMPDEAIVRYYGGEMDLSEFRCGGLWTTLFVSAKGDVYACWLKRIGNVREQPIDALWNSPDFRAFRRQVRGKLPAPCVGCCLIAYKGS